MKNDKEEREKSEPILLGWFSVDFLGKLHDVQVNFSRLCWVTNFSKLRGSQQPKFSDCLD